MKHESPEVVQVGITTVVIKGEQLKHGVVMESFPNLLLTAPAYEADE
jgi:hypothetical protein